MGNVVCLERFQQGWVPVHRQKQIGTFIDFQKIWGAVLFL
jgi:hypothetical protein